MRRAFLIGALILVSIPASASARPGDLDPTFSTDGLVRIGDPSGQGVVPDAAVAQSDGSVVVAMRRTGVDDEAGTSVMRLTSTGAVDRSFGDNGTVSLPPGAHEQIEDMAVAPSGAIVLVGYEGRSPDAFVAQLRPDGRLDPEFSGDGIATVGIAGHEVGGQGVAVGPDGEITVVGYAIEDESTQYWALVARLRSDGTLDGSFSDDGLLALAIAGTESLSLSTAALGPDGSTWAAGSGYLGAAAPTFEDAALIAVRLDSSGALDATFAGDGIAIVPSADTYPSHTNGVTAADSVLDAGGGFVVAWDACSLDAYSTNCDGLVSRIATDGTLDRAFGGGGVSEQPYQLAKALLIDDVGRIVSAGAEDAGRWPLDASADLIVHRMGPGGSPDRGFGNRGTAEIDLQHRLDLTYDMVDHPDGRLAVVGTSEPARQGRLDLALARLEVTPGVPDRDADGVRDKRDACPGRYGRSQEGCPRHRTSLRARHRPAAQSIVGRLRSSELGCRHARIALIARRRGPDRVVTRLWSHGSGEWSANESLDDGTYYAVSRRQLRPSIGVCRAARSKRIRVG